VWLSFDPQAGKEQAKRRPAMIISPSAYNEKSGLCVACPITSQQKGYPFEVVIPPGKGGIGGVVLADHVKSLDWNARQIAYIDKAPSQVMLDVRAKLKALLTL
jgi:mRNA interferase MazF